MAFVERYGNTVSEDGWRMVDQDECEWVTVRGTDVRLQIRKGVPATIMAEFAARFNERIEPLRDPDSACWTETNDVPTSNHLAGTACDFNWDSHPFHVAGTYGDKLPALRALLDEFDGGVWWGGDWTDPIDEMHFQLNWPEGDPRNDALAAKLGSPPSAPPTVMTVPLTANTAGTWTSTSPAWAHLIARESGGDPTIIQQIVDVNSGGNEAEGLFQITPATWGAHGGDQFAPTARLATPQQQAIVAARIFTANPSGSDWGAGLPGREDPGELAAGLIPLTETPPSPQPEEDWMADPELARMIREIHDALYNQEKSRSRYGDDRTWNVIELIRNLDGVSFDSKVEHDAAYNDPWSMAALRKRAVTDPIAAAVYQNLIAPTPAPTPTSSPTQPPPQTPIIQPPIPHPQSSGPMSLLEAVAQLKVTLDRLIGTS